MWSSGKANKARLALLTPTKYVAESDLSLGISDLSRFLYESPSTMKAARAAKARKEQEVAAAADTLRERYGLGISDEDMDTFGRYMEWLRKRAIDEIYDSGEAVEDFEKLRSTAADIEGVDVSSILKDFRYWTEHREELEDAKRVPAEYFRRARGQYGQTSRQLRNALSRYYNS